MIIKPNSFKFFSKFEKYLISNRLLSAEAEPKVNDAAFKNRLEWQNALTYKSIPGPTKLNVIKGFLPYGKYRGLSRYDFTINLQMEYGDIIRLPSIIGNPEIVILFDPDWFETIYRTEGIWPIRIEMQSMKYYRHVRNPKPYEVGNLLTEQGERWGKFRSIANPILMQPKTVRVYVPRMDKVTSQFVEKIRKIRDPVTMKVPGTFEREMNQWALESVCVVALNTNLGLIDDGYKNPDANALFSALNYIFTSDVDLGINPPFWKLYETPKFKALMNQHDKLFNTSKKLIEKAIDQFKSNTNSDHKNVTEGSVFERLVNVNKDVAIIMALEMLFAGVDTTTSAVTACLLCLAENPDKQDKLRSDLKEVLPNKDTPITEDILKKLPYLRAVIKESLRMYPVTNENARATGQNVVIKNYQVPKGTHIIMVNGASYKNEKYFYQANQFIPERWLRKENVNDQTSSSDCPVSTKPSNPFVYLPFGFGSRMCIGKRIVDMEMEIALAKIIRNFHVEFNYPTHDMFTMHLINRPNKELKFKFEDV